MFNKASKWFLEVFASGATAGATGGASTVVNFVAGVIRHLPEIILTVALIVILGMYGCEKRKVTNLTADKVKLEQTVADTKAQLALCDAAVDTCRKSSDTYKGDYAACLDMKAKQQIACGDLVGIIQNNCAARQKIDDAVKKAEQQKKTSGTYSAADLIKIYNEMIRAKALLAKPAGAPK